jgi:hypothetical protein
MNAPGGRWRLIVAAVLFALAAPAWLAALPLAALLAVAPEAGRGRAALAAALATLSVAGMVASSGTPVGGVYAAWTVLVTAAFVGGALVAPAPFFRQASRAVLLATIALAGLGVVMWGPHWLDAMRWDMTRQVLAALRVARWVQPELQPYVDDAAGFAGATLPAQLVLQALAGLAVAWQVHTRLAPQPLGPPLRPFREFRLGDVWVWGLVLAGAVWLLGQPVPAQNLAVVLGTLYFLQGAAIVTALAAAAGMSTGVLVTTAALSAVLLVPLLLIVPGLWTLGVTDTWLEYRRRIAAGRPDART